MNTHINSLKNLIKLKTNNVITTSKAEEILSALRKKHPTASVQDTLVNLDKYSELPAWLRDTLTINETFFFRHPSQFNTLSEYLKTNNKAGKQWNILCCGVSTGEEAYSLSFICQKVLKKDFKITGIDLSNSAIEKATRGVYDENLISRIPSEFKTFCLSNFNKIKTPNAITYSVKDDIRKFIRFKSGNIFNFPLANYDIIFARNMLIYFSDVDKRAIAKKLFSHLKSNGIIFIGGGELFPEEVTQGNTKVSTSIIQKAG